MAGLLYKVPNCSSSVPSGAIQVSVSCPRTLRHADWRSQGFNFPDSFTKQYKCDKSRYKVFLTGALDQKLSLYLLDVRPHTFIM